MSSVNRRIAMGYCQRAPSCERCASFQWLPDGGGPYCSLGAFHVKPIGICDNWKTAKTAKTAKKAEGIIPSAVN